MSKELLLVIESVANEKEVSKDILFSAMEEALAIATKKRFNGEPNIRVTIDRKDGNYTTCRMWDIVDEDFDIVNYESQLYVDIAIEKGHDVKVGDVLEENIESIEFGRIAAMAAKQIIIKKIREAEKERIMASYSSKIGKIVYGEVKRITREFIVLDLGQEAEGVLFRKDIIPRENYRMGDKVRACLLSIDPDAKNYQLILTRTDKKMLEALLYLEVPEIAEQMIDLVDIVRDPGFRAKVAVKSNDKRIDPVGACVGMRGSRIQAITNELNGERVDVVLWDESPAQYIINALSPAEIVSIIQDEDTGTMDVAVKNDMLPQAIGKSGQNVRLASELTGWNINVMGDDEAEEKQQQELLATVNEFISMLDIEQDVAEVLVEEGFTTLEEIAYVDTDEMLEINGFDLDVVEELQERAKTALISKILLEEKPEDNLMKINGMTKEWANSLTANNILTQEDFAELSVDEVVEIIQSSKESAADLIMTARAPWFENGND